MVRKISTLVFAALLLVVIVIGFIVLRKNSAKNSDPFDAIPMDAALILKVNRLDNFMTTLHSKSEFWKELANIETIGDIDSIIIFLDSISGNSSEISDLLGQSFLLSAHAVGKDYFDILFLCSMPRGISASDVKDKVKKFNPSGKVISRKYEGAEIFDVYTPKSRDIPIFSFVESSRVFIVSQNGILVEEAIRQQANERKITSTSGFNKVMNTSGKNVEGNLYINFREWNKFLGLMTNAKVRSHLLKFRQLANWAELDISIKNDALLLNGFTQVSDSDSQYLRIFLNQKPIENTIVNVIPASTVMYLSVGLSDINQYLTDYKYFLENSGLKGSFTNSIKGIQTAYNTNLEELMINIFDGEAAVVYTDTKSFAENENDFVIIKTKSKSLTEDRLSEFIKEVAKKENRTLDSYRHTVKLDSEISFKINEFPVGDFPGLFFGTMFSGLENHYYAFVDNYLIFGSTVNALSRYLQFNLLQKTLVNELDFREFNNYLSTKSNFNFYSNISGSRYLLQNLVNNKLKDALRKNEKTIKKFNGFGFQFSSSKGMLFNNLFFKYTSEVREEPITVWESLLDTAIMFKPQIVENHTTGNNEIFVQDLKNNIYLLNHIGRVLWKVRLPEQIEGNVYQIDYYRNNKLQLLFNSKNYLYIIDRLGNFVENYPIKLRSSATNGLALFDYENSRDYRMFIACEDSRVYAYEKDGSLVKGWEFDKSEYPITSDIQHFRDGSKDYIVFGDKIKTYILDRKGNIRVPVKEPIYKSLKNNYIFESIPGKPGRLVITDTAGVVNFISFDGTVEKTKVSDVSANHFFDYQDMNADAKPDFIFLDKQELKVIDHKKSKMFSYSFPNEINLKPFFYKFSQNNRKIGVTNEKTRQIFLFNRDGSIYKGFPLKGSTHFSIGSFDGTSTRFNLIVGSSDNFLYNYSVQ